MEGSRRVGVCGVIELSRSKLGIDFSADLFLLGVNRWITPEMPDFLFCLRSLNKRIDMRSRSGLT